VSVQLHDSSGGVFANGSTAPSKRGPSICGAQVR
jgi:hypothetical protein